jgi:hypothetical protein
VKLLNYKPIFNRRQVTNLPYISVAKGVKRVS